MALIKCPECGKEISDKSIQCIHCGFPLNYQSNESNFTNRVTCIILGKEYDCTEINDCLNKGEYMKVYDKVDQIGDRYFIKHNIAPITYMLHYIDENNCLPKEITQEMLDNIQPFKTNLAIYKKWIKLSENPNSRKTEMGNQIVCPKCGSTHISTGERGFSIWTGFLGAGQTVNRCAKCGYKWKP